MSNKRLLKDRSPKVSVLMPIYNRQDFLNESLDSILTQTYENFELILVNDGSTDQTEEIILSKNDKRIRYLKNSKNLGIVKSLNKGLYFSTGEFVARMDSDDVSLSHRIETQINYLVENSNTDILGAALQIGVERANSNANSNIDGSFPVVGNEYHKINLLRFCTLAHPTVVFKRESFLKNNLYYDRNSQYAEDYKLWADASINNLIIEDLTEELVIYGIHDKQLSNTHCNEQKLKTWRIQLSLANFYFGNLISGREMAYLKLINKTPIQEKEEISTRQSLFKELILFNHEKMLFNQDIFSKAIHPLI